MWDILWSKLNKELVVELSSKMDKCFESTIDLVEIAKLEGPLDYDEQFTPCFRFTIIFNCMTSVYVPYN